MSGIAGIDAIKKVFTQLTMKLPEYGWMKKYPSTVYQSAFIALKNAFRRWRNGLGEFPKKNPRKKVTHLQFIKHLVFIRKKVNQPYLLIK
ncbi:MAG: hypothetical protein AAFS12_03430 [Cyanobacteria bacterium J06632_19]